MYEAWVCVALLGIWSCLGVLLKATKKRTKQLDDIIAKLDTNGLGK
jgi:hypothetical protein